MGYAEMRPCDDGYPSCRLAEAGNAWCRGDCVATRNTKVMVIELLHPAQGMRFDSVPGEKKTITWRGDIAPRIVSQVRAGKSFDWGGASVPPSGYVVKYDGPYKIDGAIVADAMLIARKS